MGNLLYTSTSSGENWNKKDSGYDLIDACFNLDIQKVMLLVTKSVDVNVIRAYEQFTSEHVTPLGCVCGRIVRDYVSTHNEKEIIEKKVLSISKYLIDHGADVNLPVKGWSPLKFMVHFGHDYKSYDIVELLVQEGAEVLPYINLVIDDNKMLNILMSSPLYNARKHAKVSKVYHTTRQSAGIPDTLEYRPIHPSNNCPYDALCSEFISTLKLPSSYFETHYDMCYCKDCHTSRGDKDKYPRGEPPQTYALPVGWCRFALRQRPHPEASSKWHRAFHGTKVPSIEKILEVGELAPAGRLVTGKKEIAELDGHYNDKWNPTGNSTKQIFVTPSPIYALSYSPPVRFESQTGQAYLARVAFQVLIHPGCYKTIPETMGFRARNRICDKRFANEQLEWCTKEQGSTILSGLLVNLSK